MNAFFASLLALIPGNNLGVGAAILPVISLFHTTRLHLGRPGARHILIFIGSLVAYGVELFLAISFVLHPHDAGLVNNLTFVLIGCFAAAIAPGSSCRARPLLYAGLILLAGLGMGTTIKRVPNGDIWDVHHLEVSSARTAVRATSRRGL